MVGIGGIGMSALAQLYVSRGATATGSDRSEQPTVELLRGKGIAVMVGHAGENVPSACDLLVYSDAVPEENPERVTARERGIREVSYFEALGEATERGVSIVVTGTHGKTTTTAMLAKVLIEAGAQPTVICGSIMSEYGSNFVAGGDLYVIEGCEYRRHFLSLHPHLLVITNIELDHTDYYRDLDDMLDAFGTLARKVPDEGSIVCNPTAPNLRAVLRGAGATVRAYPSEKVPDLLVPGTFNRENAQAAKAVALAFASETKGPGTFNGVDASLASFRGTWRRFEYKGTTTSGARVYDDYAHHPTAIARTLDMVRQEFPSSRVVVVFHPHLYSRTRDLMEGFADALAKADEVLLAPIYPAREAPIEGVTSEVLADKVSARGTSTKAFVTLEEIEKHLDSNKHALGTATLLITMGAGDIYRVAEKLTLQS